MILILGQYPNKQNEHDGMVRRIKALDSILSSWQKTYVQNTRKKRSLWQTLKHPLRTYKARKKLNIPAVSENNMIYDEITPELLSDLARQAQIIYIHSLYFLQLLPLQLIKTHGHKIILDLHGCVVEEMSFCKEEKKKIKVFKELEKAAFQYIQCFVCVSKKMIAFYQAKYKNCQAKFLLLPIFNIAETPCSNVRQNTKLKIIYAGGLHKWQNVDAMVDLIKETYLTYDYVLLTHDVKQLKKRINKKEILNHLLIQTVPPSQIRQFYAAADLGLLLREKNIVNEVACPTKIIEYLEGGVVPVVLQPEIGDLNSLGYQYVLKQNLLEGNIPSAKQMQEMRTHNFKIVNKLRKLHQDGISSLHTYIHQLKGGK